MLTLETDFNDFINVHKENGSANLAENIFRSLNADLNMVSTNQVS